MIVITILNGLGLIDAGLGPLWLAGAAAWAAAALLFVDTRGSLKIQVGLILGLGIGLILFARRGATPIDFDIVVSSSTGLMTMIAAVGFLRLVVIPDTRVEEKLPQGHRAFWQTILGLNISASVINISAPILIADRIHAQRPLDRFAAQTITRIFCGVSSWSPFFGAMAVILTYVSEASLSWVMLAGFPFTLIGFVGVYGEARLRFAREVEGFVGYPMLPSSLKVPAILIATVLALSQVLPDTPILVLIALSALLVTVAVLLFRRGLRKALAAVVDHVRTGLPRIVNELCLFLAAGVLAAGISALILGGVLQNPFAEFDAITAAEVLAIIVFCGFCGIHPIIMISSFAPMILTLEPDPNLLAATFLFCWNLGTCASPLSGTNLVFQGRYGLPSWKIAVWNWPYAIVMTVVGALWLQVVARFLP